MGVINKAEDVRLFIVYLTIALYVDIFSGLSLTIYTSSELLPHVCAKCNIEPSSCCLKYQGYII